MKLKDSSSDVIFNISQKLCCKLKYLTPTRVQGILSVFQFGFLFAFFLEKQLFLFSLELFNLRTEVGNDFCSLCSWAGRKNVTNF